MPKIKYQKGDKVICLKGYDGSYKGRTYTVVNIDRRGWFTLKEACWGSYHHNPARFMPAKLSNQQRVAKRKRELSRQVACVA